MTAPEATATQSGAAVAELAAAARAARVAARRLARCSGADRRTALEAMAASLEDAAPRVLAANAEDVARARAAGTADATLDRLGLDERRLAAVARALCSAAALPDPLGRTLEGRTLPNGLRLQRRTVPLGVLGIIYEARPNVTVDASADPAMALEVVDNAKTRRVSICNALDTLLVHAAIAPALLAALGARWADKGVEIRADARALSLLPPGPRVRRAEETDWGTEFLAPVAAVRVVDGLDDA